ncbi:DNA polymerase III subunit delta' [Thermosulfurimonas sp.]|uniref:DNA polymerase III subunit delta' n=1 Tax=Thermosulfurimonas sp. TaxID=2080236 RepID=UPI0025F6AD34|nr:DNA polymerase III subunit delta' [Thermosulfurimonas sp.]
MKLRNLSELLGQEPAVRLFRRALKTGRLAQAYLLVGPEGTGKESSIWAFLREIFCTRGEGCGECRPCRKLDQEIHPDVLCLRPQTGKSSISIAQVREAEEFLRFRPLEAPLRAVVIPEAERLSPEAANALLKSLEEPPAYAHFFLTAISAENLLPTIVSRTQVVRFRPLPPDLIRRILEDRLGFEPEQAHSLALLAEGSPGRALSLSEKGLLEDLNRLITVARHEDPSLKFRAAEALARKKNDLPELLDLVRLWLWYSYLHARKIQEFPGLFPDPAPVERIWSLLDLVEKLRQGLERYVNPELTLLVLILEFAPASSGP